MDSISPIGPQRSIPLIPKNTVGGLKGRRVTLLDEAKNLSQQIGKMWKEWSPEEWAEKIIDLEGKVSRLEGSSPAIDKVKRAAEHHHFEFVFPAAFDLKESVSISFARNIHKMAKAVLQSQSLEQFHSLNRVQKQEVMRYASGGEA